MKSVKNSENGREIIQVTQTFLDDQPTDVRVKELEKIVAELSKEIMVLKKSSKPKSFGDEFW